VSSTGDLNFAPGSRRVRISSWFVHVTVVRGTPGVAGTEKLKLST